jgi:branched-chain amino acid transport system ATP-binding protein
VAGDLLVLESIDTGYGETQVLWGVSLKVPEKGLVALLGSNGAGKTTTLRTIAGLLRPWRGRIRFADQDITRLPAHRRVELGVSLVPEGRGLFPGMSVYENLLMGAYTKRAREKIRDSLEFVFNLFPILRARLEQKAGTLSGGEQQMLAIARGLMSRPRLLMIDEASLGLAPRIVSELMRTIVKIRDNLTLIFSSFK